VVGARARRQFAREPWLCFEKLDTVSGALRKAGLAAG
jgi:hypothetical protein